MLQGGCGRSHATWAQFEVGCKSNDFADRSVVNHLVDGERLTGTILSARSGADRFGRGCAENWCAMEAASRGERRCYAVELSHY